MYLVNNAIKCFNKHWCNQHYSDSFWAECFWRRKWSINRLLPPTGILASPASFQTDKSKFYTNFTFQNLYWLLNVTSAPRNGGFIRDSNTNNNDNKLMHIKDLNSIKFFIPWCIIHFLKNIYLYSIIFCPFIWLLLVSSPARYSLLSSVCNPLRFVPG